MTHDQPRQNGNVPKKQKRAWLLLAMSVASLANLSALVIGARIVGLMSATHDIALVLMQTVAAGACLTAVGMLLRERGSVFRMTKHSGGEPGWDKETALPSKELLEDKRWLSLVEGMVGLLDELEKHRPYQDPAASDLAEHMDLRVEEILERSGVTVITGDTTFDRNRHQAEPSAAHARAGALVMETLRHGLAVGRRVFRRARVRLANGGTVNQDNPSPDQTG